MSCLQDILCGDRVLIGIRDYDACSEPESELWINDLPGMSLKKAASVSPEQWQSGNAFIQNCINMAVRHVFDEFKSELGKYFDFSNIIESRQLERFSTTVLPAAAMDRGIVLKRWRSEAARIYIDYILVNVNQAGDAVIKVVDGGTETTFNETLVVGVNHIDIRLKTESEEVKILFDQTNFDTLDCSFNKVTGSCGTCGGGSNRNFIVTGWDGTKEVKQCFGIGVNANVQCFEENVLCNLIPKMHFLIWYKSGIVFLQNFLASDRLNHATIFGKEQAKALLDEYQLLYKEKYDILVKSAYNYLKSTKGECITCNGNRYVQSHP